MLFRSHRFMAGVYLSTAFINLWAAITIRRQGTLIYLLALGILLAGLGRLLSISQVGLPQPAAVWLGDLVPELLLPVVIAVAHSVTTRNTGAVAQRPNPSLKPSPNGKPPGPVCGALHSPQPGPGAFPLVPA